MKTTFLVTFFVIVALCLCGCSRRIVFTEDIREQLEGSGIELTEIQFYTSENIEIKKTVSESERTIERGKIKEGSQTLRETIVFTGGFKSLGGLCKDWKDDALGIYFEEGDERKRLPFIRNQNGHYSYYSSTNYVSYDGTGYFIQKGNGALLLIDKRVTSKLKTKRRKVKGLYL